MGISTDFCFINLKMYKAFIVGNLMHLYTQQCKFIKAKYVISDLNLNEFNHEITRLYFRFSVTKLGNQYDGRFYFLVDEERYAYFETDLVSVGDSTPATFATVTVELLAGQIVRIENAGSTTVYGLSGEILRSWFTGHLLYVL